MADRRRIVVLGALAEMPVAGVAWQVLHYLEGFRRLGHDVCYVEDTGKWPYDPYEETVTDDASGAVRRLGVLLDRFGFDGCWAFRNAATGDLYGMSAPELASTLVFADVLVNLSGVTVLGERHLDVPIRIYLETDPVTPQIEIAQGRKFTIDMLAAHTHHFTFGERIGTPGCAVPAERFRFGPTRQPVVLDWWATKDEAAPEAGPLRCTTIASWEQSFKDILWNGETYTWSKSVEFEKLLGVPARVGATLELALAINDDQTVGRLLEAGFLVRSAQALSDDPDAYRSYIQDSGAEFTAAKDQHVRLRSGWFSDRSATYLAAGRPVIVQDTGFDAALPTGEGLLAFRTPDEAVAALEDVAGSRARHAAAAREVAKAFDAETVLARLLHEAGA
jgi:hypothetical protein